MFVQLPNGKIFTFIGFVPPSSNGDVATIYYTDNSGSVMKHLLFTKPCFVNGIISEDGNYLPSELEQIQKRIALSLKNNENFLIIPKPGENCIGQPVGYMVLFNTLSDNVNDKNGTTTFQSCYNKAIEAVKNGTLDVNAIIPVSVINLPLQEDAEWITSLMLNAKYIRIVCKNDNNYLYQIVSSIAKKYNLTIRSSIKMQKNYHNWCNDYQ